MMNSVERVLFTINQTPQEQQRLPKITPENSSADDIVEISTSNKHLMGQISSTVPHFAITTTANATSSVNLLSREYSEDDMSLLQISGWPWKGGIVFRNVSMRYREDFEPVLRGVNVAIHPGERLGIVGRTGSGKR